MGYIPFKYLADFFKYLAREEAIEIISYENFVHGNRDDMAKWKKACDPKKRYVVIQHDVDSQPQRSLDILQIQQEVGIPSNVMIFNQRVDRGLLRDSGELAFTEYLSEAQLAELKDYQNNAGTVIGYHSNAYEKALFDLDKAHEIFQADLQELRNRFTVNYYSYHGGIRDADNKSNECLGQVEKDLRVHWVHNGDPLKFARRFSDGGLARAGKRKGDLLRFVRKMKRGKLYQILIHPQYYSQELIQDDLNPTYANLKNFRWYREIIDFYADSPRGDYWLEKMKA